MIYHWVFTFLVINVFNIAAEYMIIFVLIIVEEYNISQTSINGIGMWVYSLQNIWSIRESSRLCLQSCLARIQNQTWIVLPQECSVCGEAFAEHVTTRMLLQNTTSDSFWLFFIFHLVCFYHVFLGIKLGSYRPIFVKCNRYITLATFC